MSHIINANGLWGFYHKGPVGIPRAVRISDMKDEANNQTPPQDDNGPVPQTGVTLKTRPKTQKPAMYKVLLLNDDYTPMEFVVQVLECIFGKNQIEAMQIMLHVHQKGVGVCGVYTYEVAETKVMQVMDAARRNQHPLQCIMEKE